MENTVPDSKYGRLFTENDVIELMSQAAKAYVGIERGPSVNQIMYIIADFEGKFPEDEPNFLLRAQDRWALGALRHYQQHQFKDASQDHLDNIDNAVVAFEQFRLNNNDRMKNPD